MSGSTCDFCGTQFYSRGVSLVGVGTFCGHKCKVQRIHANAGLFSELRYYRCANCQAVMTTPFKEERGKPYFCRCWTRMAYQFSVPVDTDERRELAARGQVWNPHAPQPEPWVCVRCGEAQAASGLSKDRPDGRVCPACYRAEEHPPLLTPEEIATRDSERAARRLAIEDRHEQAIQQQELENQSAKTA